MYGVCGTVNFIVNNYCHYKYMCAIIVYDTKLLLMQCEKFVLLRLRQIS